MIFEELAGYILGILVFSLLSILFHELGHFRKAQKFGLNPVWYFYKKPFRIGIRTNGNETIEQSKKIIEGGILLGLVVVVISFTLLGWWGLWVLASYLWGINRDVKEYIKLRK